MRLTQKKINQRGDTIVEVLIVLAILAFALSISFASADRSLGDSRQSRQNSYAAELAQGQIEAIRALVINSTPTNTGAISNLNANGVTTVGGIVQNFCVNPSNDQPVLAGDPSCTQSDGGTSYTVLDQLVQTPATQQIIDGVQLFPFNTINTFSVTITWDDALGQGKDTTTLYYRAYPPALT